ncbi:hypothetical protein [Pseudoxanthomonas sp.]|jgi:hypothetical protein|uniref:hypothetical protein n=1 Tax=Pseudoxanthomonas sp. TaxID=1871049 RepID=UPI002FE26C47
MPIDVWGIPKRLTKAAVRGMSSHQVEEIRARLSRRGPDADFTAVEAAIYLGRSERTLKRAIDAGVGPKREKNPDVTGRGAVNRHTHFPKRELDSWRASLYGFASSLQSTFGDFESLTEDQPWVVAEGRVFCHLMDVGDIDDVLALLAEGLVEFYRLDEALLQRWASLDLRNIYCEQFEMVVDRVLASVRSAGERDSLLNETVEVSKKGMRNPL